jgi:hypothetical protein
MQAPRHKIASLIKTCNGIGYAGCIGVAFSESVKLAVRKRAHFQCCLCKSLGVEVHHIVPQSENGADTEENAVPLCPSCHETYGANPLKRKFITEARDLWYEICRERYASDNDRIERLIELLEGVTASFTGFQPYINRLAEQDGEDGEYQLEPRTEAEILEALEEAFDLVWYDRNGLLMELHNSGRKNIFEPEVLERAEEAAREMREKYGAENVGPYTDIEWGRLLGKLSTLRWVMGDEWDVTDT